MRAVTVPLSTVDVGDKIEVVTIGAHVTTRITGVVAHIGYAGRKRILHAEDNTIIGTYTIGEREPTTYMIRRYNPEPLTLFEVSA